MPKHLTKNDKYDELLSRLSPQATKVLKHLTQNGTISNVEANAVHCIRSVSRRITEIREALDILSIDYEIYKDQKRDLTGQRYVRYTLRSL